MNGLLVQEKEDDCIDFNIIAIKINIKFRIVGQ